MNDIDLAPTLSCASSAIMKTRHQWFIGRSLVEDIEVFSLAGSVRSWSISLNALFWPMHVYDANAPC